VVYTFFVGIGGTIQGTSSFNLLSLIELVLLYSFIFFAAHFAYKREDVTFRIPYSMKTDLVSLAALSKASSSSLKSWPINWTNIF